MSNSAQEIEAKAFAELVELLGNPRQRIKTLYYIIDKDANKVIFQPNEAQNNFLDRLWYRNIVPKARQRGISTVVQIAMLDAAVFTPNITCAVIAQTDKIAKRIFAKIKMAYDNLPAGIRAAVSLVKDTQEMMVFSNGSSISVSTSFRGDTLHWLHVSEFGKICAKFPDRAVEIVTGTLPALASNGIGVIESTAEGREGAFYDMVQEALRNRYASIKLTKMHYRIHFYSWWDADEYQLDPDGIVITQEQHAYFDEVEVAIDRLISNARRAWYVMTLRTLFRGDTRWMMQEFPSTVEECFALSTEGAFYRKEMAYLRQNGRICSLPVLQQLPCETYWDIGSSDGCAIWVKQQVGNEARVIRFYECWNEPYSVVVKWLQDTGLIFSVHYLPHDADHVRQGKEANKSPRQMLEELMIGHRFEVLPRIQELTWGINQTRDIFSTLWIDETECAKGINHLDMYSRKWDNAKSCWRNDEAEKYTGHSEAADALRQYGQSVASGNVPTKSHVTRTKRATGRTV